MAEKNYFRNLAEDLSKERLDYIGAMLRDKFDDDFDSLQKYRKQ